MPTVMCCGLLRWALTLTRFLQLRYAAVPGANYAMRFTLLDMTYPQLVRCALTLVAHTTYTHARQI